MRYPNLKSKIILCLSLLSLTSCASTIQVGGDPDLQVYTGALPRPERMDMTAAAQPYLVGPFDRLTIDVFGIDELSKREVQVDASGRISFPLAGVLEVSGLTPGEIEQNLATRLRGNFVRTPQVTVNIRETISQLMTIHGEVKRPGLYPVVGHMTLLRAIARAEGTTEFSKLDDVIIFRTVQGKRLAALYDLKAIRHGVYEDPEVFANDLVMVGDSVARRRFKDVLMTMPAIITPLIIGADRLTR